MKKQKRLHYIFLVELIFLVLFDQGTKLLAVRTLKKQSDCILIPGILRLTYVENRGIAFGLLQNHSLIFGALAVIFVALLILIYFRLPDQRYFLPLMIVLPILGAGALGNCIDRAFRGCVIDFIYLEFIHFPVFNFADICVVCGALVLAVLLLFFYKEKDFSFLKQKK